MQNDIRSLLPVQNVRCVHVGQAVNAALGSCGHNEVPMTCMQLSCQYRGGGWEEGREGGTWEPRKDPTFSPLQSDVTPQPQYHMEQRQKLAPALSLANLTAHPTCMLLLDPSQDAH